MLEHFHAEHGVVAAAMVAGVEVPYLYKLKTWFAPIPQAAIIDRFAHQLRSHTDRRRVVCQHGQGEERAVAAPVIEHPLAGELPGEGDGRIESASMAPRHESRTRKQLMPRVMSTADRRL